MDYISLACTYAPGIYIAVFLPMEVAEEYTQLVTGKFWKSDSDSRC